MERIGLVRLSSLSLSVSVPTTATTWKRILYNKNSKSMEYGVAASVLFAGLNMNGKYLALTKKYCL